MAGSRSHEELVRAIMDWLQVKHPTAGTISISTDCIFCEPDNGLVGKIVKGQLVVGPLGDISHIARLKRI